MSYQKKLQDLTIAASRNIKEKEYWLNKLSGDIEKSYFPCDPLKNGTAEPHRKVITFSLKGELYSRLMKVSAGADHTIFVILAAGLVGLLGKYTGNDDIIVGTSILKQEIEGEFINTVLALRNQIHERMTFKEMLMTVSKTFIEANQHQNYPIETLIYQLDMDSREDGEFLLFDVMLLWANIHKRDYIAKINANMIFLFKPVEGHILGEVEYNAGLYEESTVQRIVTHFSTLLETGLFHVDTPLTEIDILSGEEREQLLYEFNNTKVDFPVHKTLTGLFEEQVARTPDRTAVVYEEEQVTFAFLNDKANRLAALLRRKGVRPNRMVGVLVERSVKMITGIMAILKAGGAYLPVNTETPEKRMLSMLEDCETSILLTSNTVLKNYSARQLQYARLENNPPRLTAPRPQIKDLDNLPVPDRSLVNYEKYSPYIGHALVKHCFSLQGTRGCPFTCAYCHKIWPKGHVFRSAENIFDEVRLYYNMGVRRFAFIDDVFNFNIKNSTRFFKLIIENGLKVQFFFPNGVRGDILTEDYIDLMVEAGTVNLALALEAASPRLQKLMGKHLNIEKLRRNLEYFCSRYPNVILDLFTMHGFPTETEEEALLTLDFIKNIKWIHFPSVSILKIYANTDMEKIALENGVSKEAIERSEHLAAHEIPYTLPFDKSISLKFQTLYLHEYFLSKERLRHVLPHQMKILTEDEMIQKYNSYLPTAITRFSDLLQLVGIPEDEMKGHRFANEEQVTPVGLHQELSKHSSVVKPAANALKILLLDISQFFTGECNMLYDVVEPPLGLMYILTYLNKQLGSRVDGKIAKSRIDFDSDAELKQLIEEFKPDIIGARSLIFHKDFFHRTIENIRDWGIDVPLIAGGPYVTSNYTAALQDQNIDLAVLGEGEVTFCELVLKIIENNKELPAEEVLDQIPGLAYTPGRIGNRKKTARELIFLDNDTLAAEENGENPACLNKPGDLSYVIFTSGSTGKPKGTLIEHRNVVNLIFGLNREIYSKYHHPLTMGLISPYEFDASVQHIFGSLLLGNRLYIVPEKARADGEQILEFYNRYQVDISDGTPVLIRMLTQAMEEDKCPVGTGGFLIAGEALSGKVVENFRNICRACGIEPPKIFNLYGPTETCVDSSLHHVLAEDAGRYGTIPIGKPLPNESLYILNRNLQLQPVGVPGELCIGGDGVGRGYLKRDSLMAEKFIPNPFVKGDRIYRTGDLARWMIDGTVDFLGRMDNQVKIRGFRIEPGEIQGLLAGYPHIRDAVVIPRSEGGDHYLCAYFTSDKELKASELREYLSKEVPFYMVPAYFVQLEKIPLMPNRKIDMKALPKPDIKTEDNYVAPRNEKETALAGIWSRVLGVTIDNIGIDTNFFEIGGHSLNTINLISEIHKEFNVKVPIQKIFERPSIRLLSEYLEGLKEDIFASIEPAEKKEYYELSPAQKRLFSANRMDTRNINYNILDIVEVENVDKEKLEKIFRALIKRHESLRTSFEIINDEPVQRIRDNVDFDIAYFETDRQGAEKIKRDFLRPFELEHAPLLRVGLIYLENGRYILMVDMHHIITDGLSFFILFMDFTRLYEGEELPKLRLQYKDYSEWQQTLYKNNSQEQFWLKEFAGEIPVLNLPTDYVRPEIQDFSGDRIGYSLDKEKTRALKALAMKNNVTLFMLLLGILNVLLAKISRQEDIIIGVTSAGRRHHDLEKIIGFFINMLALRNYPAEEKTFTGFLAEVKTRVLNAFENQDYSFQDLGRLLKIKRDASRNPLFDVVFSMQKIDQDYETQIKKVGGRSGLKVIEYRNGNPTVKYDLVVACSETVETLDFNFEYAAALFKKETVRRFIGYFEEIIDTVLQDNHIRLDGIRLAHELVEIQSNDFSKDLDEFEL